MQVLVRDNNVDQALRVLKKCRGQRKRDHWGSPARKECGQKTSGIPEFMLSLVRFG